MRHYFLLLSYVVLVFGQIEEIVNIMANLTQQQYDDGNPWLRMAHAKQHGCVIATLTVNSDLSTELAQGTVNMIIDVIRNIPTW